MNIVYEQMDKLVKNKLKSIIRESLSEILSERKEKMLKNMIKEEIKGILMDKAINEEKDDSKRLNMKRNAVMSMLKNDLYDHATLAYQLYDANDDSQKATARSLFSKKATGHPDADGQIRRFDDIEINKLYDLLRTKK